MKLFQEKAKILHNQRVGPDCFKMGLDFAELAGIASPGQFVMVRIAEQRIPLLRRPFSIHNSVTAHNEIRGFEILYKVVGQGTRAMSGLKAGDVLDVLGPLGNGFACPEGIREVFLVAGGIGVAPLYYLACFLDEHKAVSPHVFLGGRSAGDILCHGSFESMGVKVSITTEDGSLGEKGVVTSLVEKAIQINGKPDIIYACGPTPMLKAISDIAASYDIGCQISLETVMACGFGVCLGCAVEKACSPGSYLHACTDGPVFDSRAVMIDAS